MAKADELIPEDLGQEGYRLRLVRRKNPARPKAPDFRPEPGGGKATVGTEVRHGLWNAGKTRNASSALLLHRPETMELGELMAGLHCCYK